MKRTHQSIACRIVLGIALLASGCDRPRAEFTEADPAPQIADIVAVLPEPGSPSAAFEPVFDKSVPQPVRQLVSGLLAALSEAEAADCGKFLVKDVPTEPLLMCLPMERVRVRMKEGGTSVVVSARIPHLQEIAAVELSHPGDRANAAAAALRALASTSRETKFIDHEEEWKVVEGPSGPRLDPGRQGVLEFGREYSRRLLGGTLLSEGTPLGDRPMRGTSLPLHLLDTMGIYTSAFSPGSIRSAKTAGWIRETLETLFRRRHEVTGPGWSIRLPLIWSEVREGSSLAGRSTKFHGPVPKTGMVALLITEENPLPAHWAPMMKSAGAMVREERLVEAAGGEVVTRSSCRVQGREAAMMTVVYPGSNRGGLAVIVEDRYTLHFLFQATDSTKSIQELALLLVEVANSFRVRDGHAFP